MKLWSSYISWVTCVAAIGWSMRCNKCSLVKRKNKAKLFLGPKNFEKNPKFPQKISKISFKEKIRNSLKEKSEICSKKNLKFAPKKNPIFFKEKSNLFRKTKERFPEKINRNFCRRKEKINFVYYTLYSLTHLKLRQINNWNLPSFPSDCVTLLISSIRWL